MTDSAGYHPYLHNAFFSKLKSGRVSFYSGDVPSLEISDEFGINSGLKVKPSLNKNTFYTFDDSIFYEFNSFRKNNPMMNAFKLDPEASRFYTGYRLSNSICCVSLGASIISLIGGMSALTDHRAERATTLLITSTVGFTISTIVKVVIGKRCLNRSIEIYNK